MLVLQYTMKKKLHTGLFLILRKLTRLRGYSAVVYTVSLLNGGGGPSDLTQEIIKIPGILEADLCTVPSLHCPCTKL